MHRPSAMSGIWTPVPYDKINNAVAPDGGAHVCAPRQVGQNKGVIFCSFCRRRADGSTDFARKRSRRQPRPFLMLWTAPPPPRDFYRRRVQLCTPPNRQLGLVSGCRILQRAANRHRRMVTGPALGSACLFSAGLWRRRPTMGPLDSQPAATILQTESSRRSTTTDEKCHPRPRHRSAA